MKKILAELFKRPITKEQSKDTGMAMVLLLLLASTAFKQQALITAAMIALIVDMTVPRLYRPVAILWLGLSVCVTPVGSPLEPPMPAAALVIPIA